MMIGAGTDQGLIRNYTPAGAILDSSAPGYSGQNVYSVTQTRNNDGTAATGLDDGSGDRTDVVDPSSRSSIWIGVRASDPAAEPGFRSIASLTWFDLDTAPGAADYIDSMTLRVSDAGGIGDIIARFAVLSDGTWYVSDDTIDEAAFDGGNNTTFNYGGGNWAALSVADASSTSLMSATNLTYNVAVNSLTDISNVGVFFEGTTPTDTTGRARIKLAGLDASVIPEPGTLSLMAVFGGAALIIRRRASR